MDWIIISIRGTLPDELATIITFLDLICIVALSVVIRSIEKINRPFTWAIRVIDGIRRVLLLKYLNAPLYCLTVNVVRNLCLDHKIIIIFAILFLLVRVDFISVVRRRLMSVTSRIYSRNDLSSHLENTLRFFFLRVSHLLHSSRIIDYQFASIRVHVARCFRVSKRRYVTYLRVF